MRPRKKGFTLIEMVVVIAILVIIAAVAIPQIINSVKKSRAALDIANARTYAEEVIKGHLDGEYKLENDEIALVSTRINNVPKSSLLGDSNEFWYKVSFDANEKYEILIFIGKNNPTPVLEGEDGNIIYPVITGVWGKYDGG
ncbi:MAG: prepilin-type N-terminal cleavage/methylation domain-containing protein [Clostridium sp.]